VQLVYALHASLSAITRSPPSLEERFAQHKAASKYVKDSLASIGCDFVPLSRDIAANGMTAVKYPRGLSAGDVLPKLAERDIVVAGGLHKAIAGEYFRVGHMGITVVEQERGDLEKVLKGIKEVVASY
jgi:alanine-glyoxylate transaminase/serine-glyoxylate transaminase/serine-pyruvate transaminase